MTWLCSCGAINLSANQYCPAKLSKPYNQEHTQITPSTYDWTLYGVAEGRVRKLLMTPNEELHAKFFSEESALVITMNDVDLDEHIHELETIAREAKARILAATEEKRNRTAKKGNKAWRVEPLGPDPTVTDSLNKVKQRSARMSKLDGMRAKMASLGLSEFEIDQMVSKMVAQARKDPQALREEAKLKGDLKTPSPPTIVTDEERIARIERRKELDKEDKAIEEAEKEKAKVEEEKDKEAPVHNDKDEKLIVVMEPEEKAAAEAQKPVQPITGKLDISTLKFT